MYTLKRNGVARTGPRVDVLLDKIEDLDSATSEREGLMSATDKVKLDELENCEELTAEEIDALLIF